MPDIKLLGIFLSVAQILNVGQNTPLLRLYLDCLCLQSRQTRIPTFSSSVARSDFNKDELAFYYVRVLEIPATRWTAYDAKQFSTTDIPEQVRMVTQERAYTSPIWYTP